MSAATQIEDSVCAKLLARSLPRPIRTKAEHARISGLLLELDEREAVHQQGTKQAAGGIPARSG
jgi:hypothetical protein